MEKITVITGANRGIGFETARQMSKKEDYRIILTSRNQAEGQRAAKTLGVDYLPLDIISAESIAAFKRSIEQQYGRLDILINNAGILHDRKDSILDISEEKIRSTFDTNTYAPLNLIRALLPMMVAQNYGRIVNVSSVLGQISSFSDYTPAYRLSKLALNGITIMLDDALKGKNILVNTVHPGWVRTDMGGEKAPLSIEEGAQGIVWAATLPDDGPRGRFFQNGKELAWYSSAGLPSRKIFRTGENDIGGGWRCCKTVVCQDDT